MSREYTNKLLEYLEEDNSTYEVILKEMLCFFSEDQIKDFCLNSFGNEGIFNDEDIISSYSSDEAVADGILFDFKELEKLGLRSNKINYATSHFLYSNGYLEDNKKVNIPNFIDLIIQCDQLIKDPEYNSGFIEIPSGERIKVIIGLNETGKFTIMLPSEY